MRIYLLIFLLLVAPAPAFATTYEYSMLSNCTGLGIYSGRDFEIRSVVGSMNAIVEDDGTSPPWLEFDGMFDTTTGSLKPDADPVEQITFHIAGGIPRDLWNAETGALFEGFWYAGFEEVWVEVDGERPDDTYGWGTFYLMTRPNEEIFFGLSEFTTHVPRDGVPEPKTFELNLGGYFGMSRVSSAQASVSEVPEPASLMLLAFGALSSACNRRRSPGRAARESSRR